MKKSLMTPAKTVKAGCGIRFDPEQLGEDTGFDFSAAAELLTSEQTEAEKPDPDSYEPENKKTGQEAGVFGRTQTSSQANPIP